MKSRGKLISQKKLIHSFSYALEGIKTAYVEEQNLRIHTIVACLVLVLGFFLRISTMEFCICLILIGLVLMAEFFNTALENIVDMITLEKNPYAKRAKDVAAAGVLVFVFMSAIVGSIIFIPKIVAFVGGLL